jgi:hypothetical protein
MITLVEPEEAWGIYGPGIDVPRMFSGPESAFAHMLMHPEEWPEDVDFWLALCDQGGGDWDALAFDEESLKRPAWYSARLIRMSLLRERTPVAVDYWFIAKFMQALNRQGYKYVRVPIDGEAHDAHICSGDRPFFMLNVRQRADWATNFLLVSDQDTLRFMRIHLVSKAGPRRGMRIALRYRKWA